MPGQRLAQNALIIGSGFRQQIAVELIRFAILTLGEHRGGIAAKRLSERRGAQHQFNFGLLAAGHGQNIPRGEFGSFLRRIHRVRVRR
jgi:hypothetical protein